MRLLLSVLVCMSAALEVLAQEPVNSFKPGDVVTLTLSGDLALEYRKLDQTIRDKEAPVGLEIAILAVVEKVQNGKVHVRHESIQKQNGHKDRLLVLTAQIETKRFEKTLSPKGTVVYASPAEFKTAGRTTTADMRGMKLILKDPKDVTLRAWVAA